MDKVKNNYPNVNTAICEFILNNDFIGVIPISPANLQIKFANISYKLKGVSVFYNVLFAVIITFLCFNIFFGLIRILFHPILLYALNTAIGVLLGLFIFLYILFKLYSELFTYYKYIYYKYLVRIQPLPLIIVSKNELTFLLLKKKRENMVYIELVEKMDIPFTKIGNYLHCNINRGAKYLEGNNFELRNNRSLIEGEFEYIGSYNKIFINQINPELILASHKLVEACLLNVNNSTLIK